MAITTASDSYIEVLLRDALRGAGIDFKEQYCIYEKGDSYCPKYAVDFLVTFQGKKVVVECDGRAYHSSDKDVDYGIQRDAWLKQHGYGEVLHFTTAQLRNEMRTVLLTIKSRLGMETVPSNQLRFKETKVRKEYIVNAKTDNLHHVTLYYSYSQVKDKVWLTYKFRDDTLKQWSQERTRSFFNVPEKKGGELALYIALKDLKRSVQILIYCPSQWLTAHFNGRLSVKSRQEILLKAIEELLSKQNYLFRYAAAKRDAAYYDKPEAWRLIVHELRSRCMQMRHRTLAEGKMDALADYNELFLGEASH